MEEEKRKIMDKNLENKEQDFYDFQELKKIIETLRGENGCPWDKEQTHESLRPYLIEESAEVVGAINDYMKEQDQENSDHICEELGDVLLQVMLHSCIAKEEGRFTIEDVVHGISEKMIRRHPHVFYDKHVDSSSEVLTLWEDIKREEKKGRKREKSPLREVPLTLPGLMRSQKVIKKMDQLTDNKSDISQIFDRLEGEIKWIKEQSLPSEREEKDEKQAKEMEIRIGDLLLEICKISNLCKVNGEFALQEALEREIKSVENSIHSINV
ncbi:MAG TPA: MazG family protein [Candidatus Merdenecus merdavium]|nr:MazG family protein [Candidatus Merdenecus merdavium]